MSHWLDLIALFSPSQVEAWFEWGGYFILFGLLFACGLGLPMPEDIPLLIAGYFIAQGKMHWLEAAIVAWLGIIGGDCMLYALGRRFGLEITRVPFVGKHLTKERIVRAEQLFDRWGTWVVAIGRLIAGIRGAMVVAAGATRFNFVKFIIVDGLAAIVSGGLFVALGYWAGKKLGSISAMRAKIKGVEHIFFIALALIIIAIFFYVRSRKKTQKPPLADVALQKAVEKTVEKPDQPPPPSTPAITPPAAPPDAPPIAPPPPPPAPPGDSPR